MNLMSRIDSPPPSAERARRRRVHRVPFAALLLTIACTVGLTPSALCQGKKQLASEEYRDQRWGFAVTPFDKWNLIPSQPNERYLIVKFTAPMYATDPKTGDSFQVEMEVFRFDKEGRSVALMDQGKAPGKNTGPKTGGDDPGEEEMVDIDELREKVAYKSYDQFLAKNYSGLQVIGKPTPVKIGKLNATLHQWQSVYSSSKHKQRGYGVVFTHPDDQSQIVLQYTMPEFKYDEWKDWFKRSADTFKFIKKTNDDPSRFDGLSPIQADRLRHKEDCERTGWNFAETEHFFIKYNIDKADFIRDLKERVEAIRKEFVKYYGDKELTEIPVLRVTKDLSEYYKYGGPGGSGGYWNSATKELVVPCAKELDIKFTWAVMNHEAFHQFIYYRCGQVDPHSWYNEGTGDYYAGYRYGGAGNFELKTLSSWMPFLDRLSTIKEAIKKDDYVPFEKIFRYSQRDYYAKPDLCYAQGWSMVYFLREGKKAGVQGWKAEWSNVLPEYERVLFETKDPVKAIESALKDLKGDRLKEMENAWKAFVLKLS